MLTNNKGLDLYSTWRLNRDSFTLVMVSYMCSHRCPNDHRWTSTRIQVARTSLRTQRQTWLSGIWTANSSVLGQLNSSNKNTVSFRERTAASFWRNNIHKHENQKKKIHVMHKHRDQQQKCRRVLGRRSLCRRMCSSRFVPDIIFSELCDRLCDQYAFPFGKLNIQRRHTNYVQP